MNENFFVENAFNVLGLESTTSEREILKQSKDIKKLLQIDEIPEFDIDLPFSKDVRSEKNIDKASQQLSNPSEKIASFFFWFYINDSKDSKALECYRQGEITEAIKIWDGKIESKPNDFTALRNKAVLESLAFSQKKTTKYLKSSLKDWKKLIFDDKQWVQFRKIFSLSCQDGVDVPALVDDFRSKAIDFLSEFYAGMAIIEEDNQIYFEYNEVFPTQHSPKVFHHFYDPLLNKMNDMVKNCDKMHDLLIADPQPDESTRSKIEKLRKKADEITDEVYSLGKNTWNKNSKIIVGRDKLAESLNRIAVCVHNGSSPDNFLEVSDMLESLYYTAGDIVASDVPREKIKKNTEAFESIKEEMEKRTTTSQTYSPSSNYSGNNHSSTSSNTTTTTSSSSGVGGIIVVLLLIIISIIWLVGWLFSIGQYGWAIFIIFLVISFIKAMVKG